MLLSASFVAGTPPLTALKQALLILTAQGYHAPFVFASRFAATLKTPVFSQLGPHTVSRRNI
jgi:hypothetical protein